MVHRIHSDVERDAILLRVERMDAEYLKVTYEKRKAELAKAKSARK